MSRRKKRRLAPGQVQASERAIVRFWPRTGDRGGGYWTYTAASGRYFEANVRVGMAKPVPFPVCEAYATSLEDALERVRALGFGAYTYEGKTIRLRSRFVAGDRPFP
jgi:hypothetical protein